MCIRGYCTTKGALVSCTWKPTSAPGGGLLRNKGQFSKGEAEWRACFIWLEARVRAGGMIQPERAIARAIGGATRFQVVFCWRGFPRSRAAGYAGTLGGASLGGSERGRSEIVALVRGKVCVTVVSFAKCGQGNGRPWSRPTTGASDASAATF